MFWLRILMLLVAVTVATTLALFRPRHMADGWAWSTTLDAIHHPAAWLVTLAMFAALPTRLTPPVRIGAAACIVAVAAVGVELVQPYVGRQAELSDLWIGAAGIATAAAFALALASRRAAAVAAAALLSIASAVVVALPAARDWSTVAARDRAFPELFDPTAPWTAAVWWPAGDDADAVVTPDVSARGPAWRVQMRGPWQGLELQAGEQDWWGHDALHVALTNPGPPFELRLRVDDRLEADDRTRSSHVIPVASGPNEFSVSLEDLKFGGEHRTLALCCIDHVYLTLPPSEPASVILLERVWLDGTPRREGP